jgi:signal transduction histidine kinase
LLLIFINLVTNAQHAIGAKGGGGTIVVHGSELDDVVRFAVRDDGPGMSDEVLQKIGTPFFTTREAGTGLGVAQCKRVVGRLGGTFRMESAPGAGTTALFTVPKATRE